MHLIDEFCSLLFWLVRKWLELEKSGLTLGLAATWILEEVSNGFCRFVDVKLMHTNKEKLLLFVILIFFLCVM